MAAHVNLTLTFYHRDWIRLRAHAHVSRKTLEEIITAALQAGLHRMGVADPLPEPTTFSERFTSVVALLAQAEALTAALTAALHKEGLAMPVPHSDTTTRGASLRPIHTQLDPNTQMKLRPKIPVEIWRNFKGHAYLQGKEPGDAAHQAIIDYLGSALVGVSDPTDTAAITALLTQTIETLTQLRDETLDPSFTL